MARQLSNKELAMLKNLGLKSSANVVVSGNKGSDNNASDASNNASSPAPAPGNSYLSKLKGSSAPSINKDDTPSIEETFGATTATETKKKAKNEANSASPVTATAPTTTTPPATTDASELEFDALLQGIGRLNNKEDAAISAPATNGGDFFKFDPSALAGGDDGPAARKNSAAMAFDFGAMVAPNSQSGIASPTSDQPAQEPQVEAVSSTANGGDKADEPLPPPNHLLVPPSFFASQREPEIVSDVVRQLQKDIDVIDDDDGTLPIQQSPQIASPTDKQEPPVVAAAPTTETPVETAGSAAGSNKSTTKAPDGEAAAAGNVQPQPAVPESPAKMESWTVKSVTGSQNGGTGQSPGQSAPATPSLAAQQTPTQPTTQPLQQAGVAQQVQQQVQVQQPAVAQQPVQQQVVYQQPAQQQVVYQQPAQQVQYQQAVQQQVVYQQQQPVQQVAGQQYYQQAAQVQQQQQQAQYMLAQGANGQLQYVMVQGGQQAAVQQQPQQQAYAVAAQQPAQQYAYAAAVPQQQVVYQQPAQQQVYYYQQR